MIEKNEKSIQELLEEQERENEKLLKEIAVFRAEGQRLLNPQPQEVSWESLIDKLKDIAIEYKFPKIVLANNRKRARVQRKIDLEEGWEDRTIYYRGHTVEERVTTLAHEVGHVVLGHLEDNYAGTHRGTEREAWAWAEDYILNLKSKLPFAFPIHYKEIY